MNGCARAAFWRWFLTSVALLSAGLWGAACEPAGPVSGWVRRDVSLLASVDGNIRHEAHERLVKEGTVAVPALVRALERQDSTYRQKREIIWCLHCIRSLEAVPALVRLSDHEGWFLVSDEIITFPRVADWDKPPSPAGRRHLALLAREAVGMAIDPTGKTTWGGWKISDTQSNLGTKAYHDVLEERKAYWREVNSWYQEWREIFDSQRWSELLQKASRSPRQ